MIQLDSEGYKQVDQILTRVGAPENGASRLDMYTLAKEVVRYGCQRSEENNMCKRCATLVMPLCVAISDLRTSEI
ncbi:MAG: hypothetical protein Q7T41_00025 [Candidatus Saccharibacteria bacterium]|nr:hypothetical protein [Candidatus Saccharibacteria bacterium]